MMRRVLAVAALCMSSEAVAYDLFVDPAGGGDFTTVGAAVAAAVAGDRVLLLPGDYSAEAVVVVSTSLEIAATYGANVTTAPRLRVTGATTSAVIRDVRLTCAADASAPAVEVANGATVELDSVANLLCPDSNPRTFVDIADGTAWIHGATFTAAGTQVNAIGGDVTIEDSVFVEGTADAASAVSIAGLDGLGLPATLTVRRSSFSGYSGSGGAGSAIYAIGLGELTVEESTFTGNDATDGGAIFVQDSTPFTVSDSEFRDNTATRGAAVFVDATDAVFERVVFADNTAQDGAAALHVVGTDPAGSTELSYVTSTGDHGLGEGGAVVFDTPGTARVYGSWFCGSEALGDLVGAALTLRGTAVLDVQGTAFALTSGSDAVRIDGDGVYDFRNVTFADFSQSAIRAQGAGTTIGVYESILHDGSDFGVFGLDGSLGLNVPVGVGSHNNALLLGAGLGGGVFDALTFATDATTVDPMFQNYIAGVACDDLNLWLDPTSPLRDLGAGVDVDGSPSDIGAFGGPWADLDDADGDLSYEDVDCDDSDDTVSPQATEVAYDSVDQDCDGVDVTDVDGDGFDATQAGGNDCNDTDAELFPGAADTWYDGVDSDCDGADDFDQDGDGHPSADHGGTDCADTDPQVHPDATDVLDDGIDQDCDGVDAVTPDPDPDPDPDPTNDEEDRGCGCDHGTPASSAAGLALAAMLLAARRRR